MNNITIILITDVTSKLVELASEIQDIKSENKSYKEELKSTQNKLTGSLEKTITLERDVRDLKSELDNQTVRTVLYFTLIVVTL